MGSSRNLLLALCLFLTARVSNAIVGGDAPPAGSNFAKFAVLLKHYEAKGIARCSGALIADDIILTAAHCLPKEGVGHIVAIPQSDLPSQAGEFRIGVVFGKTAESSGTELRAISYAVHPDHDDSSLKLADLALIRFAGIRPAWTEPARIYPMQWTTEAYATVLGFGLEEYPREDSVINDPRLKTTELRIRAISQRLSTALFDMTPTNGVSKGDSGSPLTIDVGGESMIVGVSAYISPKNSPNPTSAAYTLVAPYLEWIHTTAAKMRELPAQ